MHIRKYLVNELELGSISYNLGSCRGLLTFFRFAAGLEASPAERLEPAWCFARLGREPGGNAADLTPHKMLSMISRGYKKGTYLGYGW